MNCLPSHWVRHAGLMVGFFCFQAMAFASEYSTPLKDISIDEKLDYAIGEAVFQKFWVPSPSSTSASDGLGPLYNARSCHSCHINNGRGHAPNANISGTSVPSFLIRFGKTYPSHLAIVDKEPLDETIYPAIGDKRYGHQLQSQSSAGITPEGDYHLTYSRKIETLADGTQVTLRKPTLHWDTLNYGPLDDKTGVTTFVAPPLVGMGLLGAIDNDSIINSADPQDLDKDGISGRVSWLPSSDGSAIVGRFGYKASTPSVSAQNQQAFNIDMGLSTPDLPFASGDCTDLQQECMTSPNGNSPHLDNLEIDKQQMYLVNLFVSLSKPPSMRNLQSSRFLEGKTIFEESGCVSCHTPKQKTGQQVSFTALKNKTFYPFTDMLLHDMGPDLASGFPSFSASPREWRTAPLWGIGLSASVSGRVGFLHDGRARTIEEAILWHGGEAKHSQQAYKQLDKTQRDTLIYFLESL
ncbi:di-heme oxidoredictase family protein [Marinomonas algarum]|uniref:C-type cytochrome n=1 Tax=Marinomonas algarum TaxID=2883105 RepID=A0A9X1LDW1_9GAMM|nr:di-heme oxidoredictase family protein [Marinomonas algarum]MCB5160468.1 c-type cytochrome [Marinomonas algarum]